jgi:hypothetical protein
MRLTEFLTLPDGTRAIVADDDEHLVKNLRPGMRIVVKFYEIDTDNEYPRWAVIKRIALHSRSRSIAVLSLRLDEPCVYSCEDGSQFDTVDIDNFNIEDREHGTHWCVYLYRGEDESGSVMNAIAREEDELLEIFGAI